MPLNEICPSPNHASIFGALMFLVIGAAMALFLWKRGAPGSRAAMLFGLFALVAGAFAASIFRTDPRFISYAVGDGNVTLGFAWPKASVTIPAGGLQKLGVFHGVIRQQERGGAIHVADSVWLTIGAGSDSFMSCRAAGSEHLVAVAKDIAAGAKITPDWRVRCEDGHELPTTPDDVGRGGSRWDSEFAPRCGAAR